MSSTNGTTSRSMSISYNPVASVVGSTLGSLLLLAVVVLFFASLFRPLPIQPSPKPVSGISSPLANQYTVLVKLCKNQTEARSVIVQLHDKRFRNLDPIPHNGSLLVCSGKFSREEEANGRLALLKSSGFSNAVVLKPKVESAENSD